MGTYHGKHQYLSAWSYVWLDILYSIPLLGFIFLVIHCFSKNNENRMHFARSYFAKLLLVLIIGGVGMLIFYLVNPVLFFEFWSTVTVFAEAYANSLVPPQF